MKHIIRILPVVAAVLFLQPTIEKKGSFDLTEASGKQPKAVVVTELQKKGSFDLNATYVGKIPDLPVVTG